MTRVAAKAKLHRNWGGKTMTKIILIIHGEKK
jgi:hypothetical protein